MIIKNRWAYKNVRFNNCNIPREVKEDKRLNRGKCGNYVSRLQAATGTHSYWDSRVRLDRVCVPAYIRYPSNYRLSEFPSWAILVHFTCMRRGLPREKSIFRVRRYILTVSMSSVTISKRLPFRRATLPQGPKSGRVIPLNRYVSLAVARGRRYRKLTNQSRRKEGTIALILSSYFDYYLPYKETWLAIRGALNIFREMCSAGRGRIRASRSPYLGYYLHVTRAIGIRTFGL